MLDLLCNVSQGVADIARSRPIINGPLAMMAAGVCGADGGQASLAVVGGFNCRPTADAETHSRNHHSLMITACPGTQIWRAVIQVTC